jgi:uncharacterized protein (TIGR00369 family)
MSILDQLLAAREADDLEGLCGLIPYARFLGMSLVRVDGELRVHLPFSDHLVGNPAVPALHGGSIGSVLETAAILQVLGSQTVMTVPRTINLTIDYQRPGRTVDTWASARVAKRGRRVMSVVAEAWQDDRSRPISTALVHLLVRTAPD